MVKFENHEFKTNVSEFVRGPSVSKKEKGPMIEIITSSAAESSTHGISHMFKRDNLCIRMFWLTCFVTSAGACGYMISLSMIDYLQFDTVTKSERAYEVSTEFPVVSICNQNAFVTNFSYEYVKKLLIDNKIVNPLAPELAFNYLFSDGLLLFRYFAGTNLKDAATNDTVRKLMGYSMEDMLLSCIYNLNPCSANDFSWYYDVVFGSCYQFNSGILANGSTHEILKSTRAGLINGFQIELFLYEPTNVMSLASVTGARVVVHNQTHKPSSSGVSVAVGTQMLIEIQRVYSLKIGEPYSKCSSQLDQSHPSQLVKAFPKAGLTYTQENCFLLCYQRYLVDRCKCYDASFDIPVHQAINTTGFSSCKLYNQTTCNSRLFAEFFSQDVEKICGEECPRECESISYSLFTSQADYPAPIYANSLIKNPVIQAKYASDPSQLTYESLKRNMVQITVYYGDLGYQSYQELEKTSLIDLISGIGGTLGLFLGMSFLSFIEVFDVILQILFLKTPPINSVVP